MRDKHVSHLLSASPIPRSLLRGILLACLNWPGTMCSGHHHYISKTDRSRNSSRQFPALDRYHSKANICQQPQHLGSQPAVHKGVLLDSYHQINGTTQQQGVVDMGQGFNPAPLQQWRAAIRPPGAYQKKTDTDNGKGNVGVFY